MNTTENISLGGLSFIIETDAYVELKSYLESISSCFENDPSAAEIIEDIEIRISELLKEKCPAGMVVNLFMIKEIEKRIGDPNDIVDADNDDRPNTAKTKTESAKKNNSRQKKFYRDIDNRVLGGVCAGLSQHFSVDKFLFRVFFLIFVVLGLIGSEEVLFSIAFFTYIILWIAMPAARTVEQKCEMRGQPLDLEGFRSKENNFEKEIKEVASSPLGQALFKLIKIIIGILLLLIGISGLFVAIMIPAIHEITDMALFFGEYNNIILESLLSQNTLWWMLMGSIALAFVGIIYGGIMMTFNLKAPSWRPGLVIFVFWLISLLVIVAWAFFQVAKSI